MVALGLYILTTYLVLTFLHTKSKSNRVSLGRHVNVFIASAIKASTEESLKLGTVVMCWGLAVLTLNLSGIVGIPNKDITGFQAFYFILHVLFRAFSITLCIYTVTCVLQRVRRYASIPDLPKLTTSRI